MVKDRNPKAKLRESSRMRWVPFCAYECKNSSKTLQVDWTGVAVGPCLCLLRRLIEDWSGVEILRRRKGRDWDSLLFFCFNVWMSETKASKAKYFYDGITKCLKKEFLFLFLIEVSEEYLHNRNETVFVKRPRVSTKGVLNRYLKHTMEPN